MVEGRNEVRARREREVGAVERKSGVGEKVIEDLVL